MYVSDCDIRELLATMAIEANEPSQPFNPDDQIQPCSIDLKLDSVFWRPVRRWTIDLRRSQLLDIQPRRYYRRMRLQQGESVILRPNSLLLGRVYEKLTIPPNYAGDITGRSSFSRLGLMVNCTGGFINPGYRGNMTLQLVNLSPNPIRLVPYLPICQLRLVQLTSLPNRLYGQEGLQSKYVEDDGGPSYWWRDKRIRNLHKTLGEVDVTLRVQDQILEIVGSQEPEVIERLGRLVGRLRQQELENAHTVLERFAQKEDRRRFLRNVAIGTARASFPFFLTAALGSIFSSNPVGLWHYLAWTASVLSLPLCIYAFRTQIGDHLGRPELQKLLATEEQKLLPLPLIPPK